MNARWMYKNFMIFIQAAGSGTMAYDLPLPDNVFIATSDPTTKNYYACHYDYTLKTYVSSCWSYGMIRT